MTHPTHESEPARGDKPPPAPTTPTSAVNSAIPATAAAPATASPAGAGTQTGTDSLPRWPFPAGSQNETDKAVKLKPYVPPKRRTLNQY